MQCKVLNIGKTMIHSKEVVPQYYSICKETPEDAPVMSQHSQSSQFLIVPTRLERLWALLRMRGRVRLGPSASSCTQPLFSSTPGPGPNRPRSLSSSSSAWSHLELVRSHSLAHSWTSREQAVWWGGDGEREGGGGCGCGCYIKWY